MKSTGGPTDIGMNRTGVQISPKLAKEMEEGARKVQPPPGDEAKIAEVRANYHSRATPVGTMPPPGTMKGMAKAAGKALKGEKATALLDKMGERLAFERTGVRLYEAMITKLLALGEMEDIGLTEEALRHIQREELEHMVLVSEAIESMGADPTTQTPCADVAGVQAEGIAQVLVDPRTTVAQGLSSILAAELVDNASWELLTELARDAGNDELANSFDRAWREEMEHLRQVKGWFVELSKREARGVPAIGQPT